MDPLDCPGVPTFRRRLIWGALLAGFLPLRVAADLMGRDETP